MSENEIRFIKYLKECMQMKKQLDEDEYYFWHWSKYGVLTEDEAKILLIKQLED